MGFGDFRLLRRRDYGFLLSAPKGGTKVASNCLQTSAVFVSSRADFITSCFHGLSCLIIAFSIVDSFLILVQDGFFRLADCNESLIERL